MHLLTAISDPGPLLLAAGFQLAGLILGAVLRELVHLWVGPDPRRARLWVTELLVIGVFAAILGVLFATSADVNLVGPPFGAALTTYSVIAGVHAYIAARDLTIPAPWKWAAAHVVACVLVGTGAFTVALLITGIGPR